MRKLYHIRLLGDLRAFKGLIRTVNFHEVNLEEASLLNPSDHKPFFASVSPRPSVGGNVLGTGLPPGQGRAQLSSEGSLPPALGLPGSPLPQHSPPTPRGLRLCAPKPSGGLSPRSETGRPF